MSLYRVLVYKATSRPGRYDPEWEQVYIQNVPNCSSVEEAAARTFGIFEPILTQEANKHTLEFTEAELRALYDTIDKSKNLGRLVLRNRVADALAKIAQKEL